MQDYPTWSESTSYRRSYFAQENPNIEYMHKIETFTRKGADVNKIKKAILDKTGILPDVYGSGTHSVINHKLTLEMLKFY